MKQSVIVPQVGESVTSGILAVWFKSTGSYINKGEDLFELETDKATIPVPSPASGTVTITVDAGEEVEIGAVIAEIDTSAKPTAVTSNAAMDSTDSTAKDSSLQKNVQSTAKNNQSMSDEPISPAVRRLLHEHGLQASDITVPHSGKNGRLTKADVESFIAQRPLSDNSVSADSQKILHTQPNIAAQSSAAVPSSITGGQERKKMSTLRKKIAENLVQSKQNAAHLTTFVEVDMSKIIKIRTHYKEQFEKQHGVRLGFMSFFLKASAHALIRFPAVNAYIDGSDIIYNHFCHIGVAVSTEVGLIVPVIRNVESLGFADIEKTVVDFAARAKAKRIMPDEFSGGTFTITNGGVFGSMLSTPIPNPPQTAILGMHSITKRAVVVDDEIVIRPVMYLALTYDHRIIDGREAIGFLTCVKSQIADPARLLLEL